MATYSKIRDEKYSSDESETVSYDGDDDLLHQSLLQRYRQGKRVPWPFLGILWATSIIMTALLTAFITWKIAASNPLGTFASGYSSDFGMRYAHRCTEERIDNLVVQNFDIVSC
jgi:hypothetical protein